jgi:multidrug efflux system outer membrane protein
MNYFSLRALDQEIALITDGVELRQHALDLVASRRKSGAATDFDVARAETELATTQAEAAATANHRASLQNALAVLVGEPATGFQLAAVRGQLKTAIPAVPAGLPSDLLERRPDIASAERSLAAANARIGVARAAVFPALTLSATGGLQSSTLGNLLSLPSRFWSIGPALAGAIFDAGGINRVANG